MKTIGLLGGMSWESTVPYYQTVNRVVGERLGGLHSAQVLLYSVDFHEIEQLQHTGRWDEAGSLLAEAARKLEQAGADFLVLCTNTMHRVAPQIESAVRVPLLHIADCAARRIQADGLTRVGLLATRFTMEQDFYRERLERQGIEALVPPEDARAVIHRVIYDELCRGKVLVESRARYQQFVAELAARGAQGVILGCTEITLLLRPGDTPLPAYDTTAIHAEDAALRALGIG